MMRDGKPSANMFAAGEIMAGNVLGQRLCGRHRHDHRQRLRPHRGQGGRAPMHGTEALQRSRSADDGVQFLPLLRGTVCGVSRPWKCAVRFPMAI